MAAEQAVPSVGLSLCVKQHQALHGVVTCHFHPGEKPWRRRWICKTSNSAFDVFNKAKIVMICNGDGI